MTEREPIYTCILPDGEILEKTRQELEVLNYWPSPLSTREIWLHDFTKLPLIRLGDYKKQQNGVFSMIYHDGCSKEPSPGQLASRHMMEIQFSPDGFHDCSSMPDWMFFAQEKEPENIDWRKLHNLSSTNTLAIQICKVRGAQKYVDDIHGPVVIVPRFNCSMGDGKARCMNCPVDLSADTVHWLADKNVSTNQIIWSLSNKQCSKHFLLT